MLFCWVWWYCVPRLRTDFVPCVQKNAAYGDEPSQTPFGGSFGGKSSKRILAHSNQINAQLLVPLEKCGYQYHRGSRTWKSPTNRYISFTLRQEIVRKVPTPQQPHTPPLSPREMPLFGRVRKRVSTDARPAIYHPKFPAFGAFLPKNGFSCAGFSQTGFTCTGKACTNKY